MSRVTLSKLDSMTRKAVKEWLHLPLSTCDGLLYCRNKDGGLGILRFEKLIPRIQVKRLCRLAVSADYWTWMITVRTTVTVPELHG